MYAEYFSFDNSSESEVIKDLCTVFPGIGVPVFSENFIIEAIGSWDLPTFVISSQKGNMGWVLEFKAEEELKGFYWIVASINKIAHKDIFGGGNLASFFKEWEEIMELTVEITANSNWSSDWLDIVFFNENFFD